MKYLIVILVCLLGISQGFSQTSASIASPTFVTNAVKRIIKATNNVFLVTNSDNTISIGATNTGGGSATNVLFNNSQFASNASSQVYIKPGATITNANFAGITTNNQLYTAGYGMFGTHIISQLGNLYLSNGNVLIGTNQFYGFNNGSSSGMYLDGISTFGPYRNSLYFSDAAGINALIFATNGNVFPLNITAALGDPTYPWGPFYITPGGTTNVGSLMVRGTNSQWYSSTSISNISLNVTNVTLSLNAITNIQQNISSNWPFSIYLTNGATVYSNGVALGGGGGAFIANSAGIATNILITNATLQGRITNVATMVNTNNGTFYGGQNFYAGSFVSFNGQKNKGLGFGLNQGYFGSYGNYAWSEEDSTRLSLFDVGYSGTSNILIELGSIGNYKGAGWPDAPALLRVGADLYIAKAETTNYNTNLLANLTARRMAADEFGSANFSITGNIITNALIRYALTNINGISRAQALPHVWLTNANGGYTIQETNTLTLSTLTITNSISNSVPFDINTQYGGTSTTNLVLREGGTNRFIFTRTAGVSRLQFGANVSVGASIESGDGSGIFIFRDFVASSRSAYLNNYLAGFAGVLGLAGNATTGIPSATLHATTNILTLGGGGANTISSSAPVQTNGIFTQTKFATGFALTPTNANHAGWGASNIAGQAYISLVDGTNGSVTFAGFTNTATATTNRFMVVYINGVRLKVAVLDD